MESPQPGPEDTQPTNPEATAPQESPAAPAEAVTGWRFQSEVDEPQPVAPLPDRGPEEISWTASEFIAHEKSVLWYGVLALVGIVGAVAMYLLTRDILSTSLVVLAAIVFGIFGARKPHVQEYALNTHGLYIGPRNYSLQAFKSFSVMEEGAIVSVVFMPLKRFMPPMTIYLAPELEDGVIAFLAARLPREQRRQDAIDSLLHRIRF